MTWTFTSTDVGSSGLATVRFLIGDYSSGDQKLTDETINAVLSNITSDHTYAAVYCCEAIAANFARQADTDNEGLGVKASQRSKQYMAMADNLRRRLHLRAGMFVGGRSKQTKDDREADTDLVQPAFSVGMDDFSGSTVDSSTSD